jgi:TRAP-type transport system periplasmic protein
MSVRQREKFEHQVVVRCAENPMPYSAGVAAYRSRTDQILRRSTMKRKLVIAWAAACLAFAQIPSAHAQQKVLKISHQFPGSSATEGDFRDQLARKFATDVEARSKGSLKVEVYPASSLVKPFAQFGAVRKGALDMSVLPLAYGGGEVPEANLGLMPALVTSYEQGLRWKDAPIGREWSKFMEDKGIKILTWVWQAGGVASLSKPFLSPDDAKGLKARGGSKEMDMMLKGAGAAITNVPSNEIYSAMQSGVLDAAVTSSTSLISFRLYETGKHLTTARKNSFWYMFEPLVISKSVFDGLSPEQQKIVVEVGASLEKFALDAAKADDQRVAEVYAKAGSKVTDMDDATFAKWRAIAQATAWKDFETNVKDGKRWLDLANAVK